MISQLLINELTVLAFAALLLVAAVEDVRRLTIPNRIPLAIIMLYPAYVLSAPVPVDWAGAAVLAGSSLSVGLILFAYRFTGGGDVKLFVAACLWAGPALFPNFLLITVLVGAAVGIGMMLHRRFVATPATLAPGAPASPGAADPSAAPRRRQLELPYGTAIAAGGVNVATTLLFGA